MQGFNIRIFTILLKYVSMSTPPAIGIDQFSCPDSGLDTFGKIENRVSIFHPPGMYGIRSSSPI